MTTTADPREMTLREFLDAGGNPRDAILRWEILCYEAFAIMPNQSRAWLADHAAEQRHYTADYLAEHFEGSNLNTSRESLDDMALCYRWEADLAEDPSLRERLRSFLTEDEAAELAESRWNLAAQHSFRVADPAAFYAWAKLGWQCCTCGTVFEPGAADACTIDGPDMDTPVSVCRSCMETALAQARH